jgi:hypothetical protein
MHYKRDGLRVRTTACEMAAQVMASRPDKPLMPMGWNLAVFFESYMVYGASGTAKAFGPKKTKASIFKLVR